MNLGGLWDNWDCFQISYIYVQLFPMRMSELMLTILHFTFIFEAYCVFILIYIYTVCSCFFFFSSVGKPPPGRPQHSALELRTNKVCVFPHSCHTVGCDCNVLKCHIFVLCVCVQCDLLVAELMNTHSEPLFYDVFMDLGGEEERKLFPLPTLVHNLQYNGQFINQGGIQFYDCLHGGQCIVLMCLLHFHRKHEKLVPLQTHISCRHTEWKREEHQISPESHPCGQQYQNKVSGKFLNGNYYCILLSLYLY